MKTLNFSKRLLCVVIAVSLVTFIGVPFVSAQTEELFEFFIIDNQAYLDKCDPSVEGHLDIPKTLGGSPVVSIGHQAFMGCLNLTSITIPSSVTTINDWAFCYTGLHTVTIPKTITKIDVGAFAECPFLVNIIVEEENPNYTSIDGVLFTKNLTELHQYPSGKTEHSYTVPIGVQVLQHCSFSTNPHLQKVEFSHTVTTVNNFALNNCVNLTNIIIPASTTTIGDDAFGKFYDYTINASTIIPTFTIHGYAGTQAEIYSLLENFEFKTLNQKGDSNHDDAVNAKDALVALQLSVGKIESTPGYIQVTDVNRDTFVNAKDALEILKKAVGKPACF